MDGLTEEQLRVVRHEQGVIVVTAAPGAGKTHTLAAHVLDTLRRGVPPERILVLTFSRIAVQAFRERLLRYEASEAARSVQVSTFHSLALGIVPQKQRRRILDEHEIRGIWIDTIQRHHLDSMGLDAETVQHVLDRARLGAHGQSIEKLPKTFLQLYEEYQRLKDEHGTCDFTDLLELAVECLDAGASIDWPEVVIVDEGQDTNPLQMRLVDHLAQHARSTIIVGDPMQAIFGFQGADDEGMARFAQRTPGARVLPLSQSWRCPLQVARAANRLIEISGTDTPPIQPRGNARGLVVLTTHPSPVEEAQWVARNATRGKANRSVLILARTNADLEPIASALSSDEIDFERRERSSVYDLSTIAGLLDIARLALRPTDTLALCRLLAWPKRLQNPPAAMARRLLGAKDVDEIARFCSTNESTKLRFELFVRPVLMSQKTKPKDIFGPLLTDGRWRTLLTTKQVERQGEVIESFLASATLSKSFDRLLAKCAQDGNRMKERRHRIVLSTIHSAKGDEAEDVFIVGADSTRLPHARSATPREVAEELRLLYVALTRAQRRCVISWPTQRGTRQCEPSRWVVDLMETLALPNIEGDDLSRWEV